MNDCTCGHSEFAHTDHYGCLHCDECHQYTEATEIEFTDEDKKEWTKIKRRVGRRKA